MITLLLRLVCPATGAHTQHVQCYWARVKRRIKEWRAVWEDKLCIAFSMTVLSFTLLWHFFGHISTVAFPFSPNWSHLPLHLHHVVGHLCSWVIVPIVIPSCLRYNFGTQSCRHVLYTKLSEEEAAVNASWSNTPSLELAQYHVLEWRVKPSFWPLFGKLEHGCQWLRFVLIKFEIKYAEGSDREGVCWWDGGSLLVICPK